MTDEKKDLPPEERVTKPTPEMEKRWAEAAEEQKKAQEKMGHGEDGTYILVETDQSNGAQTVVCAPHDNLEILRFAHPKIAEGWIEEWGEAGFGYMIFKAVGGLNGAHSAEEIAEKRKLAQAQEKADAAEAWGTTRFSKTAHTIVGSKSSNIFSIGYSEEDRLLEVKFKNGRLYRYDGVPPEVHEEFVNAESFGKFFASNIKDQYDTEKVQ